MLNAQNVETVIYDNLSRGHQEAVQWGHFVHGDLADRDLLRRCFQSYPIDAVMHFASLIEVGESVTRPAEYYRNNVVNTLNLLDVMVENEVKYLIFSSSCAVYGKPLSVPIREDHPQQPINPYGKSKGIVEQILKDYEKAYGLHHVCLRYFNAAGADPDGVIGESHDPETHLIPIILQAAKGLRPHVDIYGTDYDTPDGTCLRDFVHVNDLVSAHILALKYLRGGGSSTAFNLSNTREYSVREVVETTMRITGQPIRMAEKAKRDGDAAALVGHADKAKAVLGWQPRYPDLADMIQTAWSWEKKKR